LAKRRTSETACSPDGAKRNPGFPHSAALHAGYACYRDEGTTTTPFDMVVLNNLDRYQLALDAITRIPRLADQVEKATERYWTTMERHKLYVSEHGEDMPEVRDWQWS
jgi:phosphoketolase